ncbi:MAG: hypothetical protein H0V09_05405, partial [Gemmatimonadetes bacterium]|nr:hypothetical protein [Gemmatimonadota bacterium]
MISSRHRRHVIFPGRAARELGAALPFLLLAALACGSQEGDDAGAPAYSGGAADTAIAARATGDTSVSRVQTAAISGSAAALPPPFATESAVNFVHVRNWPKGVVPSAPSGFRVTLFAEGLEHPRWLYELPNGDVLVAESNTEPDGLGGGKLPPALVQGLKDARLVGPSADRITLLGDVDGDGTPEVRETFLEGLNQPFGMLLIGETFYVANTDGLLRFPYRA